MVFRGPGSWEGEWGVVVGDWRLGWFRGEEGRSITCYICESDHKLPRRLLLNHDHERKGEGRGRSGEVP